MDKKDSKGNSLRLGDIVVYFHEFFYLVVGIDGDESQITVRNLFEDELVSNVYCSNVTRLDETFYRENKQYLESILNRLEKSYQMIKSGDRCLEQGVSSTEDDPVVRLDPKIIWKEIPQSPLPDSFVEDAKKYYP